MCNLLLKIVEQSFCVTEASVEVSKKECEQRHRQVKDNEMFYHRLSGKDWYFTERSQKEKYIWNRAFNPNNKGFDFDCLLTFMTFITSNPDLDANKRITMLYTPSMFLWFVKKNILDNEM